MGKVCMEHNSCKMGENMFFLDSEDLGMGKCSPQKKLFVCSY